MNPDPDAASRPSDGFLEAAATELRAHADPGWVRVRSSAIDRLRDSVRSAQLVQGRHSEGEFLVSGQVLRTFVRDAAAGVAGTRLVRVTFSTGDSGVLSEVSVQVAVAYGQPARRRAGQVRGAVRGVLVGVLGEPGRRGRIDVAVVDVYR